MPRDCLLLFCDLTGAAEAPLSWLFSEIEDKTTKQEWIFIPL